MYKLIKTSFITIAALTTISCATSESVAYQDPVGCSPRNVVIKVELDHTNSMPKLKDKAQRVVCIKAGSSVTWTRDNSDGNKNFTIFFKESKFQIPANHGRATYTAPQQLPSIDALSYGIKMPDASKDLDPIIIIVPGINQN